jgi:DNA-binding SARP family transcriptional activator
MLPEVVINLSHETFFERVRDRKVVLFYPWNNNRNLFLSYYFQQNTSDVLYHAVAPDQDSLVKWLTDLINEVRKIHPQFGAALQPALKAARPVKLAESLASDLGTLVNDKPIVLYIDQLDHLPFDDALEKFITTLVKELSANIQIVINSRRLNYQPWAPLVATGEVAVVGTEFRKDDVMLRVEKNPRPQLEVYALGRGYVISNGQLVTQWDGILPRHLLYFFMDRPLVTRKEIFETFWPTLGVREATNVFHVTKRKISERISEKIADEKSFELTRYSLGFYSPSEKITRHYDVADFQHDIERALVTTDETEEETLLRRAVQAYRGPFLQDDNTPWIVARRDQLRQLNAQAYIGLGRISKRRQDTERALDYFSRSLIYTPEREDIHREMMSLFLKQDRKESARQQYLHLVDILDTLYHINPARETQDLYQLIQSS